MARTHARTIAAAAAALVLLRSFPSRFSLGSFCGNVCGRVVQLLLLCLWWLLGSTADTSIANSTSNTIPRNLLRGLVPPPQPFPRSVCRATVSPSSVPLPTVRFSFVPQELLFPTDPRFLRWGHPGNLLRGCVEADSAHVIGAIVVVVDVVVVVDTGLVAVVVVVVVAPPLPLLLLLLLLSQRDSSSPLKLAVVAVSLQEVEFLAPKGHGVVRTACIAIAIAIAICCG